MCEKFCGGIDAVCKCETICDGCRPWLDETAKKIVEQSKKATGNYGCSEFILLRVAELLSGQYLGICNSPESRLELRAEEVVDLIRAQAKKCSEGNNMHYRYMLSMVAEFLIVDSDLKKSFGWATAGEI